QPFTCCAPPRRNECDVSASTTPALCAMRSRMRLTCVKIVGVVWSRTSTSGVAGERSTAASTWTSGKFGQVTKSVPGNSESPCSSDVFMRMKRTKKTSAASIERFCLWTSDKSEARPNRYHSRHSKAASW
ncbi:hypothetical protein PHYSODRAFT_534650, partial [Phytophthora sojae]